MVSARFHSDLLALYLRLSCLPDSVVVAGVAHCHQAGDRPVVAADSDSGVFVVSVVVDLLVQWVSVLS
jgi:hypothetical protein